MSETAVGKRKSERTGVLWWLGRILAWVIILALGAALAVAVLVPRIGGAMPYTILTGSMRPTMPPGTLVVTKPVPMEEIGIGTVITYQLESGKPTVVTHRVVSVGYNTAGDQVLRTQGDANDVVDKEPITPVQVKGRAWYSVPYLGYVNAAITQTGRTITMIVVVSGLLLYAVVMFAGALRDRLRSSRPARTPAVSPGHGREDEATNG